MKKLLVPAAVTLAVVVAFVAIAGSNKSAEPLVSTTLTERELRLANAVPDYSADDPGVQLQIEYTPRENPLDARNWLNDDRMRDIGFVFDVMPGAPEAEEAYRRALPRLAWVAFEYNGNAWREIDRQRAMAAEHAGHRHGSAPEPSRLVPIDAARDAETLVRRYPNGHLIVRASIELVYLPPSRNGPLVYGRIRHLVPPTVAVARAARSPLAGLGPNFGAPRYEVDLRIGPLGIPYVTGIRRITSAAQ